LETAPWAIGQRLQEVGQPRVAVLLEKLGNGVAPTQADARKKGRTLMAPARCYPLEP